MWLISNPLFEIGAGLVLIAATIWALLNAIAPRPSVAAPAERTAPPPAFATPDPAPVLGPLSARTSRAMYFAEEDSSGSAAEPPLRLAPAPPPPPSLGTLSMRLPEVAPAPLEPAATETEPEPEPMLPTTAPAPEEPPPIDPLPDSGTVAEAPPPIEAPASKSAEVAESLPPPEPPAAPPSLPELLPPLLQEEAVAVAVMAPVEALADFLPEEPAAPVGQPPSSAPTFEVQLQDWLHGLLASTAGAPAPATVTAASTRMKRGIDPAWPEPARDLRALIEGLGKLAPAVFAAPGAHAATASLAEAVGRPFALIWPEIGEAFDPVRHEARSGEGSAVAAVIRPGAAYGEGAPGLPALVVRESPPSTASA